MPSSGKTTLARRVFAALEARGLDAPLAFDPAAESPALGRFVLVDDFEISGGGLVREALEARLFDEGRFVYFLGTGSVLYGLDADVREGSGDHAEDIRRLAEVAHLLLDAGLILVATASRLAPEDQDLILAAVDPSRVVTAWVGDGQTAGLACDLRLGGEDEAAGVESLRALLARRGLLKA